MKEIMDFRDCEDHLKKVDKDDEKISSIMKMCKARLKTIPMIKLDEETASVIAVDYYEVIKELLVAFLLKNGLKSDNHECLISFFKETCPQYDYEARVMHELKYYRNRASYDGEFIKMDYVERNKAEFDHIISLIFELVNA
ncbi:MAG: hypothetical protein ABIJ34_02460 [archaeon]